MISKKAPTIALGTIILNDFDNTRKIIKPAIRVTIAVLVPDWNMPHITTAAANKKNILSFFIFEVIPNIRNATADALALQP